MAWTQIATRAALAAVAVLLAACSSSEPDVPIADAGPTDTGTSTGEDASDASVDAADAHVCKVPGEVQGPACTTCLQAECCSETEACLAGASCKALDDCVTQCLIDPGDAGVADCAQGCASAAPAETRQAWRDYNDCLVRACNDNGGGPCL